MCQRRYVLFLFVLILLCSMASPGRTRAEAAKAEAKKPNFLIIISDDQRSGTLGQFMPEVQSRIFDAGVSFRKAYITTPACCPSRSTMLTGMYVSKNDVLTNRYPLNKKTLLHTLQDGGYKTALIGKYLNTWDGSKRPEADYWVSFPGGSSRYFDPLLNVNGSWKRPQGYMTYLLRDYALDFLSIAEEESEKPFALFFTPNAPHGPFEPAPEDVGRWKNVPLPRNQNFNRDYGKSKPAWIRKRPPLQQSRYRGKTALRYLDDLARAQLEMLWSLDQSVGAILDKLVAMGELDNTFVLYISDNGYLWGEHRLGGKDCVYEEATRVPLAIRYPALFPEPRIEGGLVANIDVAPTLLQLAGLEVSQEMDGISLVDLATGAQSRENIVIEGFRTNGPREPFAALHTGRFVYVINRNDVSELYDLQSDPYQVRNLERSPAFSRIKKSMQQVLLRELWQLRPRDSLAWRVYGPAKQVRTRYEENPSAYTDYLTTYDLAAALREASQ